MIYSLIRRKTSKREILLSIPTYRVSEDQESSEGQDSGNGLIGRGVKGVWIDGIVLWFYVEKTI